MIADDHDMVRHGFRMVLSAQPDLTVVGEAGNGTTTWDLVRRLRPRCCWRTSGCPASTASNSSAASPPPPTWTPG
ncbi:hypothetical protein NKG94_03145 [Micromonospora sp. M12]